MAAFTLLRRLRSRRARKKLALLGWLCLAAFIATYGVIGSDRRSLC